MHAPTTPLHLLLLAAASRPAHTITVEDCSANGKSVFRVNEARLTEDGGPVTAPGKISVWLDAELTQPLEAFDLDLKLYKWAMGQPAEIPCVPKAVGPLPHVGSCLYKDVCAIMAAFWKDKSCMPPLQCGCPLKPQRYALPFPISMDVPSLPGNYIQLAEGTYEVRARLLDSKTGEELSCTRVRATLEEGEASDDDDGWN